MTTTPTDQQDHLTREAVGDELAWAPQVKDTHLGVSVRDGVVTLSGEVDTFTERVDAMRAALRVSGVTVVANDITIRTDHRPAVSDSDLAAAIHHVLEWSADLPKGTAQVEVRDRVVTLTGVVRWNYQRTATERLIRTVAGVLDIDNQMTLTARASAADAAQHIKSALVRHALVDAAAISVTTVGSEVTLTGHVSTWAEKTDAAHAAWSSPHVSAVHDKITVGPTEPTP